VEGGPYSEYDVSDHPYTLLDGDDYFPDIMLGRVSFQNIMQLMTVVNKIIAYEKEPDTTEDWFTKAIMVGGIYPSYDNYSPRETLLEAGRKLLEFDYTTVHNHIYPEQTSQTSLENLINEGCSIINYRGCGSYDHWSSIDGYNIFANENLMNLNNGFKLPFVTSIVCGGGNFAVENIPSCFGELWLNAGDPGQPKGAIGFIGPSEYNTATAWNNCNDLGIYQGFTQEGINTCAGLMLRGKMELYNNYPDCHEWGGPEESDQLYFYVYNLLGDPGLKVKHSSPQEFEASCASQIAANQNFLPISIANQQDLGNFSISVTHQDSLINVAKTNTAGLANIPIPTNITDFTVTVSKYGFIPYIKDVSRNSEQYLQFTQHSFTDPPQNSSSNQLNFTIKNNNQTAINSIDIDLSSVDNYFQIDSDPIYVEELQPEEAFSGSFQITAATEWKNLQSAELVLEINSDAATQEFLIQTTLFSPEVIFANFETATRDYLLPNFTEDVYLELENTGETSTADFSATLSSLSSSCQIIQNTADYASFMPGTTQTNSNPFQIQVLDAYPGNSVSFLLQIKQAENLVYETQFELPVGMVNQTAPTYSNYGYCAIESRDVGDFDVPAYNWIEINPELGGNGTLMQPDYATSDAAIQTLGLPFTLTFFNRTYDYLTICTQGWLSMGTCDQVFHRNRQIPSGNGPHSLIAPFWDEMEDGQVHYYYDSENNQFIVQWSNWENYDNNQNTFQVIIFDPNYYQTSTDDAKILFQYKEIHNEDQENNYATVGIENFDESDGVELSYANREPASAHPVESETAILFTIAPYSDISFLTSDPPEIELFMQPDTTKQFSLELSNESEFGNAISYDISTSHFVKKENDRQLKNIENDQIIRGNNGYIPGQTMYLLLYYVHNAISEPVHGVTMDLPSGCEVLSAADIEELKYNEETGDGALISWGFGNGTNLTETGVHSFQVKFVADANMNDTIEIPWYIEGDGSGSEPHSVSSSIFVNVTSSSYIWLQYPNGGEHLIATTQDTVRWEYYGDFEFLDLFINYEEESDWQLLAENIPNTGEFIFEVPAVVSNECKVTLQAENAIDFSQNPFTISALDITYPTAQTVMQYNTTDSLKWENFGQIETVDIQLSTDNGLTWQDLASGIENTGSSYFQVPGPTSDYCHLRIIDPVTGLTNQTPYNFKIKDTSVEWLLIDNDSGTIPPGSSQSLYCTVNTEDMAPGDYLAYLQIISSSGRKLIVPINLNIAENANHNEIPSLATLEQNYPNPFLCNQNRNSTKIKFHIPQTEKVELTIYNSRGRQIKTLISQKLAAGEHQVWWNGTDDNNKQVASGVYFYSLQTSEHKLTKKLILMK
jgi:hypothetical protein